MATKLSSLRDLTKASIGLTCILLAFQINKAA